MGVVTLLMVFMVIPTSLPPSSVPAASATTCRMWVVHGWARVDVVSECLEERRRSQGCLSPFCKLQAHGADDFKGLPNNEPKLCSASSREG